DDGAASRPLLRHVPPQQRGPLMNYFLSPVRAGVKNPAQIVQTVLTRMRSDLQRRRQWHSAAELEPLRQALLAVIAHPSEALQLAGEALDWEQLPRAERERRKAVRGEVYRRQYLSALPPTDKQLRFLRSLGHDGPVENRLHASALIDELLAKRGAHQ